MGYKMKGYSYPGKSPLKQDKVPNMTEEESKAFRNRWNAKIDMVEEMKDHAKTIGQADDGMRIYEEGDIMHRDVTLNENDPVQKKWARTNKNWKKMKKSPAKQKPKKSTESAHGQLGDAEREYQEDLKTVKRENLDHIGTGFMNPPYKDTVKRQKQGVPYAKRQGYHGFKDFDSIIPQSPNKQKKEAKNKNEISKDMGRMAYKIIKKSKFLKDVSKLKSRRRREKFQANFLELEKIERGIKKESQIKK